MKSLTLIAALDKTSFFLNKTDFTTCSLLKKFWNCKIFIQSSLTDCFGKQPLRFTSLKWVGPTAPPPPPPLFFFYQGFLSQTLTIHRATGEWWGLYFISLYLFYLLINIQIFIYNLHVRWLPHIFNRIICNYQAATEWDLQP